MFTLTRSTLPAMVLAAACAAATLTAQTVPEGGKNAVPALVSVLESTAGRKEKTDALRQLSIVGGKEILPALIALLADEELSHMALNALQTMPDPAVDAALRQALGTLKGRPLVGVIHTLGARRDAKAVKPLAGLLNHADPDVARGAARALGSIGTRDAAKVLLNALDRATPPSLPAFAEGALRCAEHRKASGDSKGAMSLYTELRKMSTAPHQVRTAALRGVLLTDRAKAPVVLNGALEGGDYLLFTAAVRTAQELPEPAVTRALVASLTRVSFDRQVVLMQELARRGDAAGVLAVAALARDGKKPARLAALRALAQFGQPAAGAVFYGMLGDADKEIAQAAQDGLASTAGAEVDRLVLQMLGSAEVSRRMTGLELVGRRRMVEAVPTLQKLATDPEAQVRTAALRRLGELGTAADLPALLDLLQRTPAGADLDNVVQAVATLVGRESANPVVIDLVLSRYDSAKGAHQAALLEVLVTLGGDKPLKVVRAAADQTDATIRLAALRSLAAWKTPDAAPELLVLAKASSDATERLLCWRGYFSWASSPEVAVEKRMDMCAQAAGVVQGAEEKKLLLGGLGSVKTAQSLALVMPHLSDAALKEEAAAAVAQIGTELVKADPKPEGLAAALQAAATATGDANLGKRLNALLQKAAN